jgi:uncharacterized protein
MKSVQRFLMTGLPLCLLLTTANPASAAQNGGLIAQSAGTISVTGDAQVNVVPDEVIITLGVETSDKDLLAAKADNDQRISKILALVKDAQVAPENVQTDFISIQPRFDDSSQRVFIAYYVHKSLVITLKDVSKFDGLLSSAVEAGANYVQGIQFVTTDLRKHRDEARALAIQAAKEKAVALAGQLGQKVGKPLNINEEQNSWYSSYGSYWGSQGSQYNTQSQNVVQNAASSGSSDSGGDGTTLAPGQIQVTARVSVTFELTD